MPVTAGGPWPCVIVMLRALSARTLLGVQIAAWNVRTDQGIDQLSTENWVTENARHAGYGSPSARRICGKLLANPRVSEELSPLELLRQENELLRETINSADKNIEEIEAQLQVTGPVHHPQTKGSVQC